MDAVLKSTPFKYINKFSDNLSILLFLVIWEFGPRVAGVDQTFIAPPSVVVLTLWELLQSGVLLEHTQVSLWRAAIGFTLAGLVGIPLGFLLGGWFKTFERILNPLLYFLGQFNPFSLFPVFILLFGIGEVSKVSMIFWVCLWPILYNTITGVKGIEPIHVKSARSMGADTKILFSKVVLPGAAPSIFTGLKLASGTAFFMLIAAEMIGASSGLGWLVWNAQTNYQIPRIYAATVAISVLGLILNNLFRLLEKKVVAWKEATFADGH
ncbi:MAG: ABC transporter permease [Clostridia bacterium]|nr:ABC transporter permease [Clostridia bacterium]